MRSYVFGLSLAALVATVACGSSSANPSGGGGSAGSAGSGGSGGGSGFSCYDLVKGDGGVAGCGMITYSAGVASSGCGGACRLMRTHGASLLAQRLPQAVTAGRNQLPSRWTIPLLEIHRDW